MMSIRFANRCLVWVLLLACFSCTPEKDEKDPRVEVAGLAIKELQDKTHQYFLGCHQLLSRAKSGDTMARYTFIGDYFPMFRAYHDNFNISCLASGTSVSRDIEMSFYKIHNSFNTYKFLKDSSALDTLIMYFDAYTQTMNKSKEQPGINEPVQ